MSAVQHIPLAQYQAEGEAVAALQVATVHRPDPKADAEAD